MVDITGHLAFGLLFAVPAWFRWTDRGSVAFVVLAAVAALLPDIDLWLVKLFPDAVHHHGVTHTVVFVAVASLVGAAVFTGLFRDRFDDWIDDRRFDASRVFLFSFTAILAGGLSHLLADILSAPDLSTPIEPFWPFFQLPWAIDLVWYNAAWINIGFFTVMIVVHVVLAYVLTPVDRRDRFVPI